MYNPTKFGIIINNLGHSQLSYFLIRNINIAMRNRENISPYIFYENPQPYRQSPLCCLLQVVEAFQFHAPLVATSLSSAQKLLICTGTNKKFFFLNDLQWIKTTPTIYDQYYKIYTNPALQLIVKCQDHFDLVKNCWNQEPVGIWEDCNIKQLLEIINV